MTGCLTQRGRVDSKTYELAVPNLEIRDVMTSHVLTLFRDSVAEDGKLLDSFCNALIAEDASKVEELFAKYMNKTISVRDTFVRKTFKENFYHGMLLGILGYKDGWVVASNKESGDGYCDIMVQVDDKDIGIVIEVKYADDGNVDLECQKALAQIDDKGYAESFYRGEVKHIIKYGMACYKKTCKVAVAVLQCTLPGEPVHFLPCRGAVRSAPFGIRFRWIFEFPETFCSGHQITQYQYLPLVTDKA